MWYNFSNTRCVGKFLCTKKQKHTFPSTEVWFFQPPRVCRFPILPQRWQFFLCCFQILVCFFDVFFAIALELLIQIHLGVLGTRTRNYLRQPRWTNRCMSGHLTAQSISKSPFLQNRQVQYHLTRWATPSFSTFIFIFCSRFTTSHKLRWDGTDRVRSKFPAFRIGLAPLARARGTSMSRHNTAMPTSESLLPAFTTYLTYILYGALCTHTFWDFKQTLQFGLHIDIPNQKAFVKNLLYSPHQNRWTARSLQYQEPMDGDIPNQGGNPRHCSQRPRSTTCISGRKETSKTMTSKNFPCHID